MRMMFPTVRERRVVDRLLRAFFETYRESDFRRGLRLICRFYNLKPPPVEWFEYLDWGKGAGRTFGNGTIHLVHPENWKRGRKYNSERQWVHTVYHEFGHYVLWSDAERKADGFAYRFVRGVSSQARTVNDRVTVSASRPRRKRVGGVKPSHPRHRPRRSRSR